MMHRRAFLNASAAVTSAVFLCDLAKPVQAIDALVRPKPGKLRLSLAAYSMRKYLAPGKNDAKKMDLFQFVDFCFEQGIPGAELTSYYFPETVTTDYLLKLKHHCHMRGITISGGAIRNDFCQQDEAKVQADVQHTKTWIDHYALLGAPAIRIFAGQPQKNEDISVTLQRCAKHCEEVCAYAAQKGILLALENHGGVTAKAEGLLDIVRQVKSSAFGVNFDSGNFRSSEDPYAELEMIAPYAVNSQIKVEIHVGGKDQATDLPRVMKILRDAGYSGWVALEYESKEEPLEAIPKHLDELKKLVMLGAN